MPQAGRQTSVEHLELSPGRRVASRQAGEDGLYGVAQPHSARQDRLRCARIALGFSLQPVDVGGCYEVRLRGEGNQVEVAREMLARRAERVGEVEADAPAVQVEDVRIDDGVVASAGWAASD